MSTSNGIEAKVAVVTGANKGIGLEIVRSLCRHFGQDGVVYLTARNEGRGRAAVELLQKEGLYPKFHLLNITDQLTIDEIRAYLEKTHGGIDVLINNAGVGDLHEFDIPVHEKAVRIMNTNYFGLSAVCHSLTPLVRSGGRIVNVASTTGYLMFREQLSDEVRNRFRQVKDEQGVVDLMNEYLKCCLRGTTAEKGWAVPEWAYGISKLGVITLSKLLAEKISQDDAKQDILLNSCCPALVRTEMTAHRPDNAIGLTKITPAEGADTPVFLARLPPRAKEPNGMFLMWRTVYDFIHTDVSIPDVHL
eukprot:XP_797022.3 PREDICTED: carbonyl reductase [NADPH] 1 [Strongylocentrotus purpuratus]